MHFTTFLPAAVFSAAALAAPLVDLAKRDTEWTIVSMKRVCDSADTTCTWTFSVDTHDAAATACSIIVTGSPASETDNSAGSTCGPYTITSGWSGQFGPGNGFTTFSVVDWTKKLIIWPAYTDAELAGGNVVTPDKSYTPSSLS